MVFVLRSLAWPILAPPALLLLLSSKPSAAVLGLRVCRLVGHYLTSDRLSKVCARVGHDLAAARYLAGWPTPHEAHLAVLILVAPRVVVDDCLGRISIYHDQLVDGLRAAPERVDMLADLACARGEDGKPLLRLLAEMPSASRSTLLKIAAADRWAAEKVAARAGLDMEMIAALLADGDLWVQRALAQNPDLSDDGYRLLLSKVSPFGATLVFNQAAVPDGLVEEMLVHPEPMVRLAATELAQSRDSRRLHLAAKLAPMYAGSDEPLAALHSALDALL